MKKAKGDMNYWEKLKETGDVKMSQWLSEEKHCENVTKLVEKVINNI